MKTTTRILTVGDFNVKLIEDNDTPMRACVTVNHSSGVQLFGKGFLKVEDATRTFTELGTKVRDLSVSFQAEHNKKL